jgi:hypothetical protein
MVKKTLSFAILAILALGCLDEPDCFQLNNDLVGILFRKLETGTADTVEIAQLRSVDPALLFATDTAISRVHLPLNYFGNEITYVFQDSEGEHFLHLTYLSQVQFVSDECGQRFVVTNLRVQDHSFDSVRLISNVPTKNASGIQIEIYR